MNTTLQSTETTPYITRQAKLAQLLESLGLDSLILNAGPSLTYLTNLHFHLSERPVLVFFIPGMVPKIVLPELEKQKLVNLPYEIEAFSYGEDPASWNDSFRNAIQAGQLERKRNGVEPSQLRLLEYLLLTNAAPAAEFIPSDECIARMRMFKDDSEVAVMRKAANIAEDALTATLPFVKIGLSERELASELTLQLLQAGCDPALPFSPIVSSGPNSANPHATPSDRVLAPGDLLVIDWGASYAGYISDITRTFAIGNIDPEYAKISGIVLKANAAGRAYARPGITAEALDREVRAVIEAAGYGDFFTHRTGHGLGMEGHEEPYIRVGNAMSIEPGMAFTIEPGIYLPGRNGVRIEDDVIITENGSDCLTSLPREVISLV